MADISKRAGSDDDCDGERGGRGKRGHHGPTGPTGPTGPSDQLVAPTDGPDALIASEDIPAGGVITPGSARLALADGTTRGNVIGIATANISAGNPVPYVLGGLLSLPTGDWDVVTDGVNGLQTGRKYFLSQTIPGHITVVEPNGGQVVTIGVAINPNTIAVQTPTSPAPPAPTGSTGPTGPAGAVGPIIAVGAARVAADGTLIVGSGNISGFSHLSTGEYQVDFSTLSTPVNRALVTVSLATGTAQQLFPTGEITYRLTAPFPGALSVFVSTADSTGMRMDREFSLVIYDIPV